MTEFGQQLSSLIEKRGFKSDEQLALRAISLQRADGRRVNVQPRTINNWRRGRTRPRSFNDKQLNLVLAALKPSAAEEELLKASLEARHETGVGRAENAQATTSKGGAYYRLAAVIILTALSFALLAYKTGLLNKPQYFLTEIPPAQLRLSPAGFVLPSSNKSVISESDLEQLTGWELYVARNEIFARYGRPFVEPQSICLQYHFDKWSKHDDNGSGWYVKRSGYPLASDLENQNALTIRNYECEMRGGQFTCDGKLRPCM